MAATLAATRDYQRSQVALRAVTYREVTRLWPLLDTENLDSTFAVFAAAVLRLIRQQRSSSVLLARSYIDAARAGVPGRQPVVESPPVPVQAILISLRVVSVISIKKAVTGGRTPRAVAVKNALVRTMGAVDKWVGDGGRELIRDSLAADPAARGYIRRTLGTCKFCADLAGKLNGAGEFFPRHDSCGCQPEPVYTFSRNAQPTLTWRKVESSTLNDGTRLGARVAAKAKQVYQLGEHQLVIETSMTRAQTAALMDDISAALDAVAEQIGKRVRFHVPSGDPKFRGTKRITGAYVTDGVDTVYLNPKLAAGELQQLDLAALMDAAQEAGFRRYTIFHELGHVMDNVHSHSHHHGGFTPSGIQLPRVVEQLARDLFEKYKNYRMPLSRYGRTNPAEAYAEAWAQWMIGGPGSNEVADAYAAAFHWRRP